MCDVVNAAMQAAGGVMQYNQLRAGARVAEQNAAIARRIGAEEEGRVRRQTSQFAAQQRLGFLLSGADPSVGTPDEIVRADAAEMELDALITRYGGQARSAAFEQQASNQRHAAPFALASGFVNAGAAAIGGFARRWGSLGAGG